MVLNTGNVVPNSSPDNLISFTAFQYVAANSPDTVAWSFYYGYNWTTQSNRIDPLPINNQMFSYSGIGFVA